MAVKAAKISVYAWEGIDHPLRPVCDGYNAGGRGINRLYVAQCPGGGPGQNRHPDTGRNQRLVV